MSIITGFFSSLGSVVGGIGGIATDIGGFFAFIIGLFTMDGAGNTHAWPDLVTWVFNLVVPTPLLKWFGGALVNDYAGSYSKLYSISMWAGIFVAAAAGASRVVRILMDQRAPVMTIFTDVLLRFGLAVLVIQVGYGFMSFFTSAFEAVGLAAMTALLGTVNPSALGTWFANQLGVSLLGGLAAAAVGANSVLVLLMLVILLFVLLYALSLLYLVGLLMFRVVMLGFAFALAPICIATAVYDSGNKFFRWWLDLYVAALTLPLVMAYGLGVTIVLATSINAATKTPGIGLIIDLIMMIGGVVMVGKLVHGLTWKSFSHGSMRGALEGGIAATMVAPRALLMADGMSGGAIGRSAMGKKAVSMARELNMPGMGGRQKAGDGLGQGANDYISQALGSRPELAGAAAEFTPPGMQGASAAERGAAAWKNMQEKAPGMANQLAGSLMGEYLGGGNPMVSRGGSPGGGSPGGGGTGNGGSPAEQHRDYSNSRGDVPLDPQISQGVSMAQQAAQQATSAAEMAQGHAAEAGAKTALPWLPPPSGSTNAA